MSKDLEIRISMKFVREDLLKLILEGEVTINDLKGILEKRLQESLLEQYPDVKEIEVVRFDNLSVSVVAKEKSK